jgi:hypothetical protein
MKNLFLKITLGFKQFSKLRFLFLFKFLHFELFDFSGF